MAFGVREVNVEVVRLSGLSPHLRGHLLQFDRRPPPKYAADSGWRLLLTAVFLEILRLVAVRWISPTIPLWLLLPSLLALTLAVIPAATGVTLTQLGLRPWREWSATERSYLVQVVIIANVVFLAVHAGRIATRLEQPGFALGVWTEFVPYLAFGFYQELVYRGLIQVEAERRWGPVVGVVLANLVFTFGPLHSNYFSSPASAAVPMFASILAIGLFFGVVYQRSRNLGMVGVFHAIGNAYMVWGTSAPQ